MHYDIHKAAAIIIEDRKLLVSRNKGKEIFVAPGGKLNPGETVFDALIRELNEEQGITVKAEDLEVIDESYDEAAGMPGVMLRLTSLTVRHYLGQLKPRAEVAENAWITSANEQELPLGSIFEGIVIPMLVKRDLMD